MLLVTCTHQQHVEANEHKELHTEQHCRAGGCLQEAACVVAWYCD